MLSGKASPLMALFANGWLPDPKSARRFSSAGPGHEYASDGLHISWLCCPTRTFQREALRQGLHAWDGLRAACGSAPTALPLSGSKRNNDRRRRLRTLDQPHTRLLRLLSSVLVILILLLFPARVALLRTGLSAVSGGWRPIRNSRRFSRASALRQTGWILSLFQDILRVVYR